MPKPPVAVEVKTRKKSCNSIIPRSSTSSKYLVSESPLPPLPLQQVGRSQVQSTLPTLPPHLDKLISEPWSPEANRQIDQFLWCVQQEFELAGGEV